MQNEEFLFKLGQKIRVLRTKKKYSQEYLAEKVDGDKGYISDIETGKANSSIIYLKQIADALECDIAELLKFTI
jgi:XRE family transcriptional regulator, aerobic/anaerobic benzoate catabolism transcriptional regulator